MPNVNKDYYNILGLTDDERKMRGDEFSAMLKRKYRQLCMKWHPDKFATAGEDERKHAEEVFKDVAEAYSVLSDPNKRSQYDTYGSGGVNGGGFPFDLGEMMRMAEEMMRQHGGGMGFDPFFGRARQHYQTKVDVDITLKEAYECTTKHVTYTIHVPCKECQGSGLGKDGHLDKCSACGGSGYRHVVNSNGNMTFYQTTMCTECGGTGSVKVGKCEACGGSGLESVTKEADVKIPEGVVDGAYTVVSNAGDYVKVKDGFSQGDAVFVFRITDFGGFAMGSNDRTTLGVTVRVGVLECMKGCNIEVKLPSEEVITVDVPAGIRHHEHVVVPGRGMKAEGGARGDLYVVVDQVMPGTLTDEESELVDRLSGMPSFKMNVANSQEVN